MIRQLVEMSVQNKVGVSVSCKDGGVLPNSGFPRDGGMANEECEKTSLGHGANISYISYMQGHLITVVSGYTFEACVFGADRVQSGVEEVVVHGSSWEVVVHVATVVEAVVLATVVEVVVHVRFGEVLDESNVFGATVVVHIILWNFAVRCVVVHVVFGEDGRTRM